MSDYLFDKISNEKVEQAFTKGLLFILSDLELEREIAEIYLDKIDFKQKLLNLKMRVFLRVTSFMVWNNWVDLSTTKGIRKLVKLNAQIYSLYFDKRNKHMQRNYADLLDSYTFFQYNEGKRISEEVRRMNPSAWKLYRSTQNKREKTTSILYEVGLNKWNFKKVTEEDEVSSQKILIRKSFKLDMSITEEGGSISKYFQEPEVIWNNGRYEFTNFDLLKILDSLMNNFEPINCNESPKD